MATQRVSDLSVAEFRALIRETVIQAIAEVAKDPDAGLELREGFAEELEKRVAAVAAGEPTIPYEEVIRRHGLE